MYFVAQLKYKQFENIKKNEVNEIQKCSFNL